MNFVRADVHADKLTGLAGLRGVDDPLIAFDINMHFKVNALEDDLTHKAGQHTDRGRHNLHILGADNDLHRLVRLEAAVHTGEIIPAEVDKKVLEHDAVHDVGITDKARDKSVFRLVVNVLRGTDLLNFAAGHDHNGVRHGKGLLLIVGDIDKGDVHLTLQALQFQLHLLAQLEVKCAQRLVQQKDARLVDQTAGNGNTLLLTAGQLMDAAALKPFQADDLEHFQHLGADFLLGHLFQAQAESDILKHIQVREERVLLEHRVHRPLVGRHVGDVLAIKKDIARFRGDKTGNHTQGCRLAAAGGAEEGDKFLVVDVQRESVQDLLSIEIDNNVFQRYDQIFIHFYCIPLCGISRHRTFLSRRFFLRPAQSP